MTMYYVLCEETGDEDAIEASSAKEAIKEFARDREIDQYDDEDTFNSITAVVLYD